MVPAVVSLGLMLYMVPIPVSPEPVLHMVPPAPPHQEGCHMQHVAQSKTGQDECHMWWAVWDHGPNGIHPAPVAFIQPMEPGEFDTPVHTVRQTKNSKHEKPAGLKLCGRCQNASKHLELFKHILSRTKPDSR